MAIPKNNTADGDIPGVRLNRYLARAGIASRRECDRLIAGGMVSVNGRTVTSPGTRVLPSDSVSCFGETVKPLKPVTAVLNKPLGYETTMVQGPRRSIADLIQGLPKGTVPIGRLDVNTGGLLLLSGDGVLVHRLMHPSWEVEREYRLILDVEATAEVVRRFTEGAYIGRGERSVPRSVRRSGARSIDIVIATGRNKEVRRLAEACSVSLSRLERIRYGTIVLDGLARGSWRELSGRELKGLHELVRMDDTDLCP